MKTKRKATQLPSSSSPEQPTANPTANRVNPSLDKHITSSLLATKTVEPHSSTKKARLDNVIVRRSQRIRNAVSHHPMICDTTDPVIQIIDPIGSDDQDEIGNSAQLYPAREFNHSRVEAIAPEPQNQRLDGSEKGTEEDNDVSDYNSFELEPEEPMNFQGKPKCSKNKSEMEYRILYVESQKKIQKLTRANDKLSKKLAVAEGKLEVYEKGSGILSTIVDKTKDLFMASAISNASDRAFAFATSHAKPRRITSTASKRKKPVASLR